MLVKTGSYIDDDYIQKSRSVQRFGRGIFDGRLKVIDMTRENILNGRTEEKGGMIYVSSDLFEEFFNTVTVNGSSIDISPSMCEID